MIKSHLQMSKFYSLCTLAIVMISMNPINGIDSSPTLIPESALNHSYFVDFPLDVAYFGYEIMNFGFAGGATSLTNALENDDEKCIYVAQGQPGADNKRFGFNVTYSWSPVKPTYASWVSLKIHVIVWPDCLLSYPPIYDLDVTAITNGGHSQTIRYFEGRLQAKRQDYFAVYAFSELLPAIQAGYEIQKVVISARQTYVPSDRSYLNLDFLRLEYVYSTSRPSAPNLESVTLNDIYSGLPMLSWTAPTNDGGASIQGYKIYRSITTGVQGDLIYTINNPSVSSYLDNTIMHGNTYYYSVVAFNENGDGIVSNQRSITPVRIPFPTQIQSVSNVYPNPLLVVWNQPQWSGLEILKYHIFRDGLYYTTVPGSQTQFIDNAIVNGISYTYRIIAENGLGNGTYANEHTRKALGVPGPATINLVESGLNFNRIYWSETSQNGGSLSLTYYLWWGNQPDILNNSIVLSGPTYTHSGLSSATMFYYKIETRNEIGWNSNTSISVNRTIGSPSKVRNLNANSFNHALNLSWDSPQYTYGLPLNYTIYRKIGSAIETLVANEITNRYYYDSNLFELQEYQYRIVPNNIYGSGESETIIAFPNTRPWKIEQIQVKGADKALLITWNLTRMGGHPIVNYSIFYRSEEMGGFVFLANTTQTQYIHMVSKLSIEYFYYIYATNILGQSPSSEIFSNYPDCVPNTPRNFQIINSKEMVRLSWLYPIMNIEHMSIPSKYHIYKGISPDVMTLILSTSEFSYDDRSLEPGKVYYYKICAENNAGNGLFTRLLRGQLVINLNITAENKKNGIEIRWTQVPDAIKYEIVKLNSTRQTIIEKDNVTAFLDDDVKIKEEYRYSVRAFNSDGQLIAESEVIFKEYMLENDTINLSGLFLGIGAGGVAIGVITFIIFKIKKPKSISFDGWN